MAKYIARILLKNDAHIGHYDELLEAIGGYFNQLRPLCQPDAEQYTLVGEYLLDCSDPIKDVYEHVYRIADRVRSDPNVVVIEYSDYHTRSDDRALNQR